MGASHKFSVHEHGRGLGLVEVAGGHVVDNRLDDHARTVDIAVIVRLVVNTTKEQCEARLCVPVEVGDGEVDDAIGVRNGRGRGVEVVGNAHGAALSSGASRALDVRADSVPPNDAEGGGDDRVRAGLENEAEAEHDGGDEALGEHGCW